MKAKAGRKKWKTKTCIGKWLKRYFQKRTTRKFKSKVEYLKGENMITKYQKEIMNHTISEPNRNWFGTDLNCKDSIEFEKLVKKGFATKEIPPSWMGDDIIYRLTPTGKEILTKSEGEIFKGRKNNVQI